MFQQCLDYLTNDVDRDQPLFLYLSFLKPHAGHNVPAGFEDLYNIDTIPIPEQPAKELVEPCHASGINREAMYREFWSEASDQQWRQMRLRYYANCSWIDSMFGRVMERLEQGGFLDNCLIVYVSDHGEMLGERYYRFNKYCLFDASVRVPIILGGSLVPPDRRGTIDHRPAELVDVLPTILQAAGIPNDAHKPGCDLLGPATKQGTFCELHERPDASSFMWRQRDYKLILTMGRPVPLRGYQSDDIVAGELYDLEHDPRESEESVRRREVYTVRQDMCDALLTHMPRYIKW